MATLLIVQPSRAADKTAVCTGKPEISAEVRPAWLDELAGYELPRWFNKANRVHIHTRLTIKPGTMKFSERKENTKTTNQYGCLDEPAFVDYAYRA